MQRSSMLEIARRIRILHGQYVLIDADLAVLLCVARERLAEVVRLTNPKLPDEFVMPIQSEGAQEPQLAFTEHGVLMAASALNDSYAIEMSIQIVRAFVELRMAEPSGRDLH